MSKFASVLLFLGLAACASSPPEPPPPEAIRVTVRDYRSGQAFSLLSTTHTDRVEFYSEKRSDASTKVQEDLYMVGLLEFFKQEGLNEIARPGRPPADGRNVIHRVIEVERDGTAWYAAVGSGSPGPEIERFLRSQQAFFELFNNTTAFQAIDHTGGEGVFNSPKAGRR